MNREETQEAFERTIASNCFGPFLLTDLLLPLREKTPEGRIIDVSADAHYYGNIDLHDLQLTAKYHGFGTYASSKLAVVFFVSCQELAERFKNTDMTASALHLAMCQ